MKAIIFNSPGDIDVLDFVNIPQPQLKSHELLIKVHAVGVNRADISQRRGTYPPPEGHSNILGLEIAGEIVEMGEDVNQDKSQLFPFKKGDRVFGLVNGGGYAEYCVMDAQMAIPMPSTWTDIQAAAIPEAFLTAWICLFMLGELKPLESVLIHAAGSGVGTAAIQMAKVREAKIYITAGTDAKIDKCLGLGADLGINYKKTSFFEEMKKATQGKGVDLILDPVGGPAFSKNLELLKTNGRLIQFAKMAGDEANFSIGRLISKRIQIKGTTLRSRSTQEKREINAQFVKNWMPLLEKKMIKPIIDRVFPFHEVRKAHLYMEDNKNFGKIILEIQ